MTKTILAAAAVLALGAGSAFAGQRDVTAASAQASQSAAAAANGGQALVFPTTTDSQVWVYPRFGYAGVTQGG